MTSKEKLNLFPSRANYVFVKQRMASAQKGLDLLKRKRDALELKLREYKAQLNKQQETTNNAVKAAIFSMARLEYLGTDLKPHGMLNVAQPDVYLRFSFMKTIGVTIPQFEISLQKSRSYPLTGLGRGGTEVPRVRKKFQEALRQITLLASIDYAVKVLEKGVHQNNMRLNGLEFVVLPRYQNTLHYIRDELDEFEREDFYRLKKGQAKRLNRQQEEMANMRDKMEDPENFKKKKKKAREVRLKNMPDWKNVYAKKLEAIIKARYEEAQAKAAQQRQEDVAEEFDEEEFEEEFDQFEYEEEDDDDNDDDTDNFARKNIMDWSRGDTKYNESLRSTMQSYAIDDPESEEGSREKLKTTAIITPLSHEDTNTRISESTLTEADFENEQPTSSNAREEVVEKATSLSETDARTELEKDAQKITFSVASDISTARSNENENASPTPPEEDVNKKN